MTTWNDASGMTSDGPIDRPRLFPSGIEQVQLYHRDDKLESAIEQCRSAGWDSVDLDAAEWANSDAMHNDLSTGLALPSYYGRNLDALHDMMQELGRISGCFSPAAAGGILVVRHFDQFVAANRSRAESVLDIFAAATVRALHYGWPLAIFLQTDDADLRLPAVAPISVEWNPGERRR